MAFQMNYTDQLTATPHPESYWEIGEFTVVSLQHTDPETWLTIVRFDGWHDITAHINEYDPIASKTYTLPPAAFDFDITVGEGFEGMYLYARSVPEPETGISFFENVIVV